MRGLAGALMVFMTAPAFAQPSCAPPQKPMLDIELMLGRKGS